jgi:hypothetical protein
MRAYRKFRRRATNLPVSRQVYFFRKTGIAPWRKGKEFKKGREKLFPFSFEEPPFEGDHLFLWRRAGDTPDIDMN